ARLPQGRDREMLRRRRHPQAQAPGEAEGRQEAHAPVRQGGNSAGGLHCRAEGGCVTRSPETISGTRPRRAEAVMMPTACRKQRSCRALKSLRMSYLTTKAMAELSASNCWMPGRNSPLSFLAARLRTDGQYRAERPRAEAYTPLGAREYARKDGGDCPRYKGVLSAREGHP